MHISTRRKKDLEFLNKLLRFCTISADLKNNPIRYIDFYEFSQSDDNFVKIKRNFPNLVLPTPSTFLKEMTSEQKRCVKVSVLLRFKTHLDMERKSDLFDLCFSIAKTIDDYDRILQAFKDSLTQSQRQQLTKKSSMILKWVMSFVPQS